MIKKNKISKKLLLTVLSPILLANASDQPKNVLFLMSDDYNYWAGTMDYHPASQTPVIDALAAKGVLFTNALNSSPVCNPSRNALMSGFRPSTTGISSNQGGYFRDKNGFNNVVSMNQFFKESGFHALATGKIYHPGSMGSRETDNTNWSELITDGSGCNGGTYKKYNGSQYTFSGNTSPMTAGNCNDHNLALKIAAKISNYHTSAQKDKPFFIACGLFRPHAPFNSPKQFWDVLDASKMLAGPGVESKWMSGTQGTDYQKELIRDNVYGDAIHSYLACLALTDHNIGLILDALDNSPLKDNTIVVFTGDHGFDLGEHGRWGKFTTTKSANHTTLIIYDPTAKGNGQKCHHPVSLQDLYPTLVDLTGLEKRDIEGVSLKHLLDCPSDKNWNHPALMTYSGTNYINTKKWYFIDDGTKSSLYNNEDDPYQWNNLYGQSQYNSIINVLKSKIDSMVNIGTKMRNDLISFGSVKSENYNPYVKPGSSSCDCEDETPPQIPGKAILNSSGPTSLSVSWNPSIDNDTVIAYQVFVNDNFYFQASETNAVLQNLNCETNYSIQIRALDNCNNYSALSEASAFVTEECDVAPPTTPGALSLVSATENSITINWGESFDNDSVAGYEVFVDDKLSSKTELLSIPLDGLKCDNTYQVKIRAYDLSGNLSDFNNEQAFQTDDCPALAVPGKIEAEDFLDQFGVLKENTSDVGGGSNIGFIHHGDWTEYKVNVAQSGAYNFDFRIASSTNGGTIDVITNGITRGSASVQGTGDWQIWQTFSEVIELEPGIQTLRLLYKGSTGFLFNLNWIDISKSSSIEPLNEKENINYLINSIVDKNRILHLNLLYSDPVVELEILDIHGRIIQSDIVPGEHEWWEYELIPEIVPGTYFIRINNHIHPVTQKFIVK